MLNQCPTCEKSTGMEVLTDQEEFEIKGEKIKVPVQYYHCRECDNSFSTEDLDDPFKAAYHEYRKLKGMVQPEQIIEFRKKYNLTQKELSDILGFGEITISRYERGSLQDLAHDRMLKLVMEPRNLYEILNSEETNLDPSKKAEITKALDNELSLLSIIELSINDKVSNVYNGYKAIQINKISEIIKFFCFNKEVFKTKLMKLFFYSDFYHYKNFNYSITGFKYAHMPYGPVPDSYEIILGVVLKTDPSIELELIEFPYFCGEKIVAKTPPSKNLLTETEIETLIKISKKFDNLNSKQISKLSHDELGYKLTTNGEPISYEYAHELSL